MRKIGDCKRAQIGVEYMIVVGFVTFAIMSVIALAFFYSGQIKDRIRLNQMESFATQLINSAESIYWAGEPSKTTVRLFMPDGISNITITSDATSGAIIITTLVSGGENKRAFTSKVPIQGTITPGEGIKKLTLEAKTDHVDITQS